MTGTQDVEWPPGLSRRPPKARKGSSDYKVSLARAVSDLEDELDLMSPDTWEVRTGNGHTKSNGMPLHNANPDDPSFVLRWLDDEQWYEVGCDKYTSLRDNVREVGKWIKETRMRENRGVSTGQSNFAAARAQLPPGDESSSGGAPVAVEPVDQRDPHDVLGVDPEAPDEVIKAAARSLQKKYHPDRGEQGDESEYKRVTAAREELLG